jgi:hypothetical protein
MGGGIFLGLAALRNEQPSLGAALKGMNRFGASFRAGMLYLLFILLPYIPVYGLLFALLGVSAAGNETNMIASAIQSGNYSVLGIYALFYGFIFLLTIYVVWLNGRLILVFPLIVEYKMDAIPAIKESFRRTRPHQAALALLRFLSDSAIPGLGMLAFCVGYFFGLHFGFLLMASAVRLLLNEEPPTEGPKTEFQPDDRFDTGFSQNPYS